jgi:hypothetical protein
MTNDIVAAALTTVAFPLTFRTEVRPYLYLASAGLMFVGYAVSVSEVGIMGPVISGVGVFMLYRRELISGSRARAIRT